MDALSTIKCKSKCSGALRSISLVTEFQTEGRLRECSCCGAKNLQEKVHALVPRSFHSSADILPATAVPTDRKRNSDCSSRLAGEY